MIVATSSGLTRAARCAKTSGLISRVGRPRSTTAWKVAYPGSPGGFPSIRMTWSSVGHLGLDGQDLPELLEARDEDRLRAAVVEERRDLGGRERRIDRHRPGARAEDRVVRHRPFRTILREDRHAVSRLHAQAVEAQGQGPDGEAEVGRRDRLPDAADLRDQEIGLPARRRDGEDVAQRAWLGAHGAPSAVDSVAPLGAGQGTPARRRGRCRPRYRLWRAWRSRFWRGRSSLSPVSC